MFRNGSRESSENSPLDLEQDRLSEGLPSETNSASADPIEISGSHALDHEIHEIAEARDLGQGPIQAALDGGPPDTSSELNPEGQTERSVDFLLRSDSAQSPTETTAALDNAATNATPDSGLNADADDGTSSATAGISIGKVHLSRRSQIPAALGPMTEPS